MILLRIDNKWYKSRALYRASIRSAIYDMSDVVLETKNWVIIKNENNAFLEADKLNLWTNGFADIPYFVTEEMIAYFYS